MVSCVVNTRHPMLGVSLNAVTGKALAEDLLRRANRTSVKMGAGIRQWPYLLSTVSPVAGFRRLYSNVLEEPGAHAHKPSSSRSFRGGLWPVSEGYVSIYGETTRCSAEHSRRSVLLDGRTMLTNVRISRSGPEQIQDTTRPHHQIA